MTDRLYHDCADCQRCANCQEGVLRHSLHTLRARATEDRAIALLDDAEDAIGAGLFDRATTCLAFAARRVAMQRAA